MKFIEKVLFIIGLLWLGLAVAHINGGVFLFVFSVFALAVFYALFSALLLNNIRLSNLLKRGVGSGTPAGNLVAGGVCGLMLATVLLGFIFKIQHWPGGRLMIFCGVAACLILALVLFIASRSKSAVLYSNILIRTVIALAFYGGLYLLQYTNR